ncbi:MAG: hypothetical protein ACJA1S_002175, partial [Cellvibrionaceae bacterium]
RYRRIVFCCGCKNNFLISWFFVMNFNGAVNSTPLKLQLISAA